METLSSIAVICLIVAYLSFFNEIMDFVGKILDGPFERLSNFFYRCHEHQ